jgi:hypothetical protein
MPGLVPGIHVFASVKPGRRGWPERSPAMTKGTTSHPRGAARPSCPCILRPRGRGECRAPSAPAASRGKNNTRVSHHGRAGFTRHSRTRMVLTVSFVVSPETGFFVSVPAVMRQHHRPVDTSIGVSGRHDFAVRLTRHSSKAPKRPPHPAPNVRDDRETPLVQGHGTAGFMDLIWANREGIYF